MEAIDGTPLADIKPVLPESTDSRTAALGPIPSQAFWRPHLTDLIPPSQMSAQAVAKAGYR